MNRVLEDLNRMLPDFGYCTKCGRPANVYVAYGCEEMHVCDLAMCDTHFEEYIPGKLHLARCPQCSGPIIEWASKSRSGQVWRTWVHEGKDAYGNRITKAPACTCSCEGCRYGGNHCRDRSSGCGR